MLHPVSDLDTAKAAYTALLGVAPQTDSSHYVGFEADGQHIGLVPAVDRRAAPRSRARGRASQSSGQPWFASTSGAELSGQRRY
jgi:hypothetical protein